MIKIVAMLAALGFHDVPAKQVNCVATAVWHEARGESLAGKVAVANVIMNRVASDRYPESACEVVYQPYQFSHIERAEPDYYSQLWDDSVWVAVYTYLGWTADVSRGATHYYAHNIVHPDWADVKTTTAVIGGHTFKVASK